MEYYFENKKITFHLNGRLSISNVQETKKEIEQILINKEFDKIIFDCNKLEYVSSAGLRLILEIGKKYSISLINVNRDVYEILDLSGFTGIFDVRRILRKISINGCQLVGKGASSKVYKYDEETMVKVFLSGVDVDRIYKETNSARKSFMAGIPTAIPYDIVECDGHYATMFEMINGISLNTAFMNEPDHFNDLSEKYANILRNFHSIEAKEGDFPDVRDKYHKWIDDLSDYLEKDEVQQIRDLFDAIPFRSTLLHLDPHGGNIMYSNGNLLFIDMADISIGHPLIDVGTEYFHYMILKETSLGAKLIFTVEPEDKTLPERIWNELEKRYFKNKTHEEMSELNKMLKYFGCLRCLVLIAKHSQLNLSVKNELIAMQRKELMPFIEEAKLLFKKANEYFN